MQLKKVSYTRGITLNIGNFESVRIDLSAEGLVESGERFEDAYLGLKAQVDAALRDEVKDVRRHAEGRS